MSLVYCVVQFSFRHVQDPDSLINLQNYESGRAILYINRTFKKNVRVLLHFLTFGYY